MMISYAQNREDVVLARALADVDRGFYVDVGANDPVHHSVTKHFYERGWSGINVEPERGYGVFARLLADRPRDINLNVGVADRPGSLAFYEAADVSGWSSFSAEQAANLRRDGFRLIEHLVPVTTLAAICAEHVGDRTIDFLKVDAESFEAAVLAGHDWSRWRPRIVVVEANDAGAWEPILLGADYAFALFDGINRFYARREEADRLLPRLAAPAHVLDGFRTAAEAALLERIAAYEVGEGLGPYSLRVARAAHRLSTRYPRLAALGRRCLGPVAGTRGLAG